MASILLNIRSKNKNGYIAGYEKATDQEETFFLYLYKLYETLTPFIIANITPRLPTLTGLISEKIQIWGLYIISKDRFYISKGFINHIEPTTLINTILHEVLHQEIHDCETENFKDQMEIIGEKFRASPIRDSVLEAFYLLVDKITQVESLWKIKGEDLVSLPQFKEDTNSKEFWVD